LLRQSDAWENQRESQHEMLTHRFQLHVIDHSVLKKHFDLGGPNEVGILFAPGGVYHSIAGCNEELWCDNARTIPG
jgi:hypothetical protein